MLIDLKQNSGLGLELDVEKMQMFFNKDMKSSSPAVRTIDQMKPVLLDKDVREPEELYYMYRDIYRTADKSILEQNSLRYDVTVIKPFPLGKEFMKTAGHYHPKDFGELYEVLFGRCFCLLQRPNPDDPTIIEEVIFVEAVAGQKIVIPPGFGHILVNPGQDYLVTSNWVSSRFASVYELYKQAGGAAYFITIPEWTPKTTPCLKIRTGIIKNPYFKKLAEINFVRPAKEIKRFGLMENSPMYNLVNHDPKLLDFLNHPLDYEYKDVFVKS